MSKNEQQPQQQRQNRHTSVIQVQISSSNSSPSSRTGSYISTVTNSSPELHASPSDLSSASTSSYSASAIRLPIRCDAEDSFAAATGNTTTNTTTDSSYRSPSSSAASDSVHQSPLHHHHHNNYRLRNYDDRNDEDQIDTAAPYNHHRHFSNHTAKNYYRTNVSIDSSPPPYAELSGGRAGTSQSTSRLNISSQSDDLSSIDSFKPDPENVSYTGAGGNRSRPSTSRDNYPRSTVAPAETVMAPNSLAATSKEKRLGHRRVQNGEVTYKKIQSSQIIDAIQLGIQHSVGSLASKPERDVLYNDFNTVETIAFPGGGSSTTPAHHFSDFDFTTYTPNAFRHFRDLFRIQPDDYMLSMTNEPLQELSNPGASGSMFFRTSDDQFIIKTVEKNEAKFLLKLLPGYYMNLSQNPRTLLPKFFGLYTYECSGKNIRLIVMDNLLPSCIRIHEKYDLKGSTYKRKASEKERDKSSPTYKDLDFLDRYHLVERYKASTATLPKSKDEAKDLWRQTLEPEISTGGGGDIFGNILLEPHIYDDLMNTLQRDCRVLESFEIMDYSLLLAVHNYDLERTTAHQQQQQQTRPPPPPLQPLQHSDANNDNYHSQDYYYEPFDYDDDDQIPPGAIRAQNHRGDRLLLFLGIIDILQSYRLFKRVEHAWKSFLHDGDSISVHRPKFYAQRFLNFMQKYVFGKLTKPGVEKNNGDKFSYYYQAAEVQKRRLYNSMARYRSNQNYYGTPFR